MKKSIQAVSIFSAVLMFSGVAVAGNLADIKQIGGVNDFVSAHQKLGDDHTLVTKQISNAGKNWIATDQQGLSQVAKIEQSSTKVGATNTIHNNQRGKNHNIGIFQSTKGSLGADGNFVAVGQGGSGHVVAGATSTGAFLSSQRASQVSGSGRNYLRASMTGNNNKAGINQSAQLHNTFRLTVGGDGNTVGVYQNSTGSTNSFTGFQNGGDTATLVQTSASANIATVDQR